MRCRSRPGANNNCADFYYYRYYFSLTDASLHFPYRNADVSSAYSHANSVSYCLRYSNPGSTLTHANSNRDYI